MSTIVISLDEAAKDLASVVRRLRECGGRAVLVSADGPLAELTPVPRPNGIVAGGSQSTERTAPRSRQRTGPRVVYSKLTGLPVVTARPGERMVTSEEIYEELRGSFP